jgi:hypothetical protein
MRATICSQKQRLSPGVNGNHSSSSSDNVRISSVCMLERLRKAVATARQLHKHTTRLPAAFFCNVNCSCRRGETTFHNHNKHCTYFPSRVFAPSQISMVFWSCRPNRSVIQQTEKLSAFEALCHKSESRVFDSQRYWNLYHLRNHSSNSMALGFTQLITEISTRSFPRE